MIDNLLHESREILVLDILCLILPALALEADCTENGKMRTAKVTAHSIAPAQLNSLTGSEVALEHCGHWGTANRRSDTSTRQTTGSPWFSDGLA